MGLKGTFSVQCGLLHLQIDYFQAINIPNCDLEYVQSNVDGGKCNNPPTNTITGKGQ